MDDNLGNLAVVYSRKCNERRIPPNDAVRGQLSHGGESLREINLSDILIDDTFEIVFIVVPIFGPVLLKIGVDPIWLAVMMGMVLQTSYLTPPFGFAIFYLQGVARDLPIQAIYRGVVPFVVLQLVGCALVWFWPTIATWLPKILL